MPRKTEGAPVNFIKLSRWLSEVEAILPASTPLSQHGSTQPTVYLAKRRLT